MPTQIVMNHNGDARHYFDANDPAALTKAEERFKQLTGKGFNLLSAPSPAKLPKPPFMKWQPSAVGRHKPFLKN
jgi:hypothetical protein